MSRAVIALDKAQPLSKIDTAVILSGKANKKKK